MAGNIDQLVEEQRAAIARNDLELFLCRMRDLFYQFGTSHVLQGRHIASSIFDDLCHAAGQRSGFELRGAYKQAKRQAHDVIVLTETVVQGGHAELIKDIVRTSDIPVMLVVTNINGRAEPVVESILNEENILDVVIADDAPLLEKLRTVQTAISNPDAKRIFLAAHGYDAVAISAITPEISARTYYLHHCDHYPALGCYLPGVNHLDLHNLGFNRCRHENNISNNRYLCLTSINQAFAPTKKKFASPCFTSATCGGIHKIQSIPYYVEYKDVALKILKRHNGVHYHMGKLPQEFVDDMARSLEQIGLNKDQFCHLGEIPNLAQILIALEVDLYIPTLPQSGGKALIDVMSAGVPILLHQNARDRLWSSIDLVYPEALSWKNLGELDQLLDRFDADCWAAQARASRSYFERFHSKTMFVEQLREGGIERESGGIPALKTYRPDVGHYLRFAGFG
jgi:hypothetical protein